MKRAFIIAAAMSAIIAACNSGDSGSGEEKKSGEAASEKSITDEPAYKDGLALVGASDCFTCHKIDDKLNGPSYREIANKYAGASDSDISALAKKIIDGGSGVWGEILMTPHPTVSQADAETMVKYILLLKK
ncbi:MAG TPA: c-type cytochrome [Chitinophagaceae bacterium]|nr:c-type cytochrome [Chitinophagaceae bacterium]